MGKLYELKKGMETQSLYRMAVKLKNAYCHYLGIFFILFASVSVYLANDAFTTFIAVVGSICLAVEYNVLLPDLKKLEYSFFYYMIALTLMSVTIDMAEAMKFTASPVQIFSSVTIMILNTGFGAALASLVAYLLDTVITLIGFEFKRCRIRHKLKVSREKLLKYGIRDRVNCMFYYGWVLRYFGTYDKFILKPEEISKETLEQMMNICMSFPENALSYAHIETITQGMSSKCATGSCELFAGMLKTVGYIQEDGISAA